MSEQVIKLFGKTIPLLYSEEVLSCKREVDSKQQNLQDDDPKTPTPDTESPQPKHHKIEIDLNDINNPQEKPLKKPDKIIPCPRCKSMETKFCYYNNYNMSQPRHLCKNCQRYWTAGGTMRNIPVGAGRRKDKYPASQAQYRHGSVSEGAGYAAHYPNIRPNGTLLAFRPDTPLSESVASILLANKKVLNWAQNDQSNMSSADENGENRPNMMQNCCIYPPQLPFSPGFPSPYSSQLVSQPGVIPMPFYPPSPFWGYAIQQPWLTPPLSNSPNSSTLGKGFRDDDSIRQSGV